MLKRTLLLPAGLSSFNVSLSPVVSFQLPGFLPDSNSSTSLRKSKLCICQNRHEVFSSQNYQKYNLPTGLMSLSLCSTNCERRLCFVTLVKYLLQSLFFGCSFVLSLLHVMIIPFQDMLLYCYLLPLLGVAKSEPTCMKDLPISLFAG